MIRWSTIVPITHFSACHDMSKPNKMYPGCWLSQMWKKKLALRRNVCARGLGKYVGTYGAKKANIILGVQRDATYIIMQLYAHGDDSILYYTCTFMKTGQLSEWIFSFMCWAREQESPVPSASTFKAFMTPSSSNMEYLIDRVPPSTGISVLNSRAFANVAWGSDRMRI